MNGQPLIDALIDALLYLELSDDSTVDADAAVETIEAMAADLQQLTPEDRSLFVQYIATKADDASSSEQSNFIRQIPSMLGLE